MFQYEELDFETLCNSEEIDPDSPEALYAMAQFYRTGKGVTADPEMYEKYLRSAAQAGSEAAARELEAQKAAPAAPKTAQAPSSLTELIRSAEKGQPDSLIPAADACARMGEPERAVRFLQKASDLIDRNIYTEEQCQEIWLKLAKLWGGNELNNPEECHRAYGMAAELHNAEAAAAYAKQCREGYGCEKDEEKALHYEAISAERGGPMEKYGFALKLVTSGKRMDAAMLLEQAMNTAQDPETQNACRLLMAYLGAAPLTPETAQWAWKHYDGRKIQVNPVEEGKRRDLGLPLMVLAQAYGTLDHAREAGLPFDEEQAMIIGKNAAPREGIDWLKYAAEQGKPLAMHNLGLCYRDGKGVTADADQAMAWFQKAADLGYEPSQAALDQMRRQPQAAPAQEENEDDREEEPARRPAANSKIVLILAVVVIAAVVWMISGFVEVLFPAKSNTAAGTGAGVSQAADSNVINPFDPTFFNQPDGVELKFSGISPDGTLIISNNLPSDNPASQIIYEADRYEGLSDLENITITASLDNSDYRLKNKSVVMKVQLDNHYINSLDELNADSWSKIKTALDEVVLANIGTPDGNGVYGENRNRTLREGEGRSLTKSTLYNLSYKTCVLLNAKKADDLDSDEPASRLLIEYTVDYDFQTSTLIGDPYTATGAIGCIYVDNLIVDGDGNAKVDSTQFEMGEKVYPDSIEFENDWISPYMTEYSMSTMDAAGVLPQ